MCLGRELQRVGAAIEKGLSAQVLYLVLRGVDRRLAWAEQSLREGVWHRRRSERKKGLVMEEFVSIKRKFELNCYGMGSQWSFGRMMMDVYGTLWMMYNKETYFSS